MYKRKAIRLHFKLTYLSLFSSGKGRVRENLWVNTSNPLACMVFTNQSTGMPLQRKQQKSICYQKWKGDFLYSYIIVMLFSGFPLFFLIRAACYLPCSFLMRCKLPAGGQRPLSRWKPLLHHGRPHGVL